VLFINGESTQQTLDAAERLGNCLGFRVRMFPRWGELEVQTEDADGKFISAIEADPAGVDMDRVLRLWERFSSCVVACWLPQTQRKQSAGLQNGRLPRRGSLL
jgi:hypothetical protein